MHIVGIGCTSLVYKVLYIRVTCMHVHVHVSHNLVCSYRSSIGSANATHPPEMAPLPQLSALRAAAAEGGRDRKISLPVTSTQPSEWNALWRVC